MTEHPVEQQPKPPFPEQRQPPPGELESEMEPRPDYGEETYRGFGRLENKAAIITGGDSGIGRAVALAFAREGADVLITYHEADSDAQETLRVVRDSGRRGEAIKGDLADPDHCREIVDRAMSQLDRVDILVNNAAFQMAYDSILDIPPEEIERVFAVNVISMFHLCQAAIPHMQPGSAIINTASIQAYQPSPELLHYAATKGAIVTFTKGLAQELAPKGIRVNSVAPGPVWTPLIPMSFPAEKVAHFGEGDPMSRPAQPAELAPAYVFLACDESRFVAGEILGVTGGKPLS